MGEKEIFQRGQVIDFYSKPHRSYRLRESLTSEANGNSLLQAAESTKDDSKSNFGFYSRSLHARKFTPKFFGALPSYGEKSASDIDTRWLDFATKGKQLLFLELASRKCCRGSSVGPRLRIIMLLRVPVLFRQSNECGFYFCGICKDSQIILG